MKLESEKEQRKHSKPKGGLKKNTKIDKLLDESWEGRKFGSPTEGMKEGTFPQILLHWRIITKYREQLDANKLNNLEEMDKFLESQNNQSGLREKNNLNKPLSINEIKIIIKTNKRNSPWRSPRATWFHWWNPPDIWEEITPALHSLFLKTEGKLPSSFQEASII